MPNKKPDPAPTPGGSGQTRGHFTLWLFAGAILLFKGWDWYMDLPQDAGIRLLGGLLEISVGKLNAWFNFLFGWLGLTALVSLDSIKRLFVDFFRPLNLIEGDDLKQFFAAPATLGLAIATFFLAGHVALSVWPVILQSRYEVVADLSASPHASFNDPESVGALTRRVTKDSPARILLGFPGSTSIVLIRDKYNLRTLEALEMRRTPFGYEAVPCSLEPSLPFQSQPRRDLSGLSFSGPRELEIRGALRWSGERVQTPMVLSDGSEKRGGWIRAGDGKDGPERAPVEYAQPYLERLYAERERIEKWAESPAYLDKDDKTMALLSLEGYDLRFTFASGELICPANGSHQTREAVELQATVQADTLSGGGT